LGGVALTAGLVLMAVAVGETGTGGSLQVGYALRVAITGVIFFGATDRGIGHAFQLSLIQLAVVAAGIVVMARMLPVVGNKTAGHKTNVTQPQQIADTVVDGAWSASA
jgi:hypothetical protein